jgi:hypothetical protein
MSHLVSFYCDMFPLIFNGSQLMSATPCDMERDMADQENEVDVQAFEHLIPASSQEPEIDDQMFEFLAHESLRRATLKNERLIQSLIRELIRIVGHDGVIRRVEARRAGGEGGRKAKGKRGRPVGLKYHEVDQQLMVLATELGIEWETRGRPRPSKYALLTKVVDLCSDREACEIFGMWFAPLGPSKASVVTRLMGRKCFPDEMTSDPNKLSFVTRLMRENLPDGMTWEGGFYSLSPTSEAWEEVHRARPDLQLLP